MKKIKIDLIMENFLIKENPVQLFEPTKEGLAKFSEELKGKIESVPFYKMDGGTLGGPTTAYLVIGLEPRESWKNGIFQNSKYFRMTIDPDGTMEVFIPVTSRLTRYQLNSRVCGKS